MSERDRHGENDGGVIRRLLGFLAIAVATVSGARYLKDKLKKKYNTS